MKILIVPDSFKGSISSKEICEIGAFALEELSVQSVETPMADGGEGSVEALIFNLGGEYVETEVTAPLGNKIMAKFGILTDKTAVIEMAEASGINLVGDNKNPLKATTYGTGELIKSAMDYGAREIIIGIGGSATNDGGVGALMALGGEFTDDEGNKITPTAEGMKKLNKINFSQIDSRLKNTNITVASDVKNPLCGVNGASNAYGRQKGAKEEDIEVLDNILANFAKIAKESLNKDILNKDGAGAAGGLGGGLMLLENVKFDSGFKIISEKIRLENTIKTGNFDLIITGEGQMNYQSVMGKLPVEVAKLGEKYQVPTIAIVGSLGERWELCSEYFSGIYPIKDENMPLEYAIKNAKELIYKKIKEIFNGQIS